MKFIFNFINFSNNHFQKVLKIKKNKNLLNFIKNLANKVLKRVACNDIIPKRIYNMSK